MASAQFHLTPGHPHIVASFGSHDDLSKAHRDALADSCDLVEIRLDILASEGATLSHQTWSHLAGLPLLFTARRKEEGGAMTIDAAGREAMLGQVLESAALVDIEVASIPEMAGLITRIRHLGVPWVASFHNFKELPPTQILEQALQRAHKAGAAVFKLAAMLNSPADLARLAEFQAANHPIAVATMGMGPLAPVSRLLCAQYGSVLNYGFAGAAPTAPGQWDAAFLMRATQRLVAIGRQG